MLRRWFLAWAFAVAVALAPPATLAQTAGFRFSFQSDVASLDPHFFDHAFTQGLLANVYEGLTRWDDELRVSPALATEWSQESPTAWVFRLRRGVVFHGGQPFTADDVVFSYQRAMGPESGYVGLTAPIERVEAIDPHSVRIILKRPYAILPRMTTNIMIMSRSWAEANGATASSNMRTGTRNFAAANANGTGPFRITAYEPDAQLRLVAFPGWWDTPTHNLTEATFRPIGNAATRVAALLSRQVDMIWPVPLADIPRVQATQGLRTEVRPSEWAILIRLNQAPEPLAGAGGLAANPFRDPRVREAIFRAIDTEAIRLRVMRGLSEPTGLPLAPTTNGWTAALNDRPSYDVQRARALLAEAGYGDGFPFTLDCPTDRFINDEAICRALTAMLARVGLTVSMAGRRTTQHFTHIATLKSDAFMVGWASAGVKDGHNLLSQLFATRDGARGAVNYAQYSNAGLDTLIDRVGAEPDEAVRRDLFARAFGILRDDWAVIPIHIQPSAWGMNESYEMLHLPDDNVRLWRIRQRR